MSTTPWDVDIQGAYDIRTCYWREKAIAMKADMAGDILVADRTHYLLLHF
jgi:hypothetical protein